MLGYARNCLLSSNLRAAAALTQPTDSRAIGIETRAPLRAVKTPALRAIALRPGTQEDRFFARCRRQALALTDVALHRSMTVGIGPIASSLSLCAPIGG